MPRHARLLIPGVPLHIRQRAIDGRACFAADEHYRLYLGLVNELSREFVCSVHAFVLMTNHVHLLVTGAEPAACSWLMKYLNQRYAQYFNRAQGRNGPLWEGRFRSSPVDSTEYLLTCYRYIEMNPVRAGMVREPSQYPWSSFPTNAWGAPSTFLEAHPEYSRLGRTEYERLDAYRSLFSKDLGDGELAAIRTSVMANAALGSAEFVEQVARLTGRVAAAIPRGRPKSVPPGGKKSLSPV